MSKQHEVDGSIICCFKFLIDLPGVISIPQSQLLYIVKSQGKELPILSHKSARRSYADEKPVKCYFMGWTLLFFLPDLFNISGMLSCRSVLCSIIFGMLVPLFALNPALNFGLRLIYGVGMFADKIRSVHPLLGMPTYITIQSFLNSKLFT